MKTKNILKIGVFSIVILSLLISPILNLHHQKASADVGIVGSLGYQSWKEILARVPETQAEKWCDAIYGEEEWKEVPFVTKNWWSHKFCVIQLSVIEGIGAAMFGLTQSLIGYILWALNPVTYGGFVKNIAVQGIWSVLRNFMNLALVLILVFIAIATILWIKKYRWQETLWKLVIVALLINFSLIIPGIILDTSHFITYTFLNLARIDDLDITDSMMKGLASEELARAGKYQLPMIDNIIATYDSSTKETSVEATGWGLGIGKSLIIATLLLLIGIFVVIALVAIFFTMIFRAFMIIALLCVAPIAFAAWILPDTEKYWKMWWQQFIKWCTYPILFALMLYIGIYIMTGIKLGTAGLAKEDIKIGLITTVVQMILFSMFLVGGLIFSIQGGGAVAQFVMKQGSKVRAFAGTKIKERTIESRPYKFAGRVLTKIPLLKVMGEEMMIAGEKSKTARIKENEKNLENISLGTLKQLEKSPLPSPLERGAYEQRIALTNRLAKMGVLGDKSIEFIKLHMQDRSFDQLTISRAVPQHFRIKDGFFGKTGPSTREKVQALGGIKENKILELTQAKEFLMDQVNEAKKQAEKAGKSEKEIEDIKTQKFDEIIQEIIGTLNPAQVNAFWRAISAKTLIEEGWGGPDGKIIQAIDKLDETKKKFREEMLPLSRALQEISGITPPKVIKAKEEPKEKIELYDQYGRKINK